MIEGVAPKHHNLARRSVSSAAWLFARIGAARILGVVTLAVLTRTLDPSDFGIIALAQVLLNWITAAARAGIGSYVIRDHDTGWQERANGAFWLQAALSVVQVALIALSIPLASRFFADPRLGDVIAVLSIVFLFQQLNVVPEALLRKAMRHRVLAVRDTVVNVAAGVLGISMALGGFGLWSLVIPHVVVQPIRLIITARAVRWRPSFPANVAQWPAIWRFAAPLMLSNSLGMILNDGDTLVVGRLFGGAALGIYNLAWQLSNLVSRNLTAVVGSVGLPAMALLQTQPDRFAAAYARITCTLAALTFPLLAGMFVLADEIVRVVYGPTWSEVVPLLRLFILFTAVRSVTSPAGSIFEIVQRPKVGLYINLVSVPVYIGAVLIGSQFGLAGTAIAISGIRIVGALVTYALSNTVLKLPWNTTFGELSKTAAAAVLMAAAVWVTRTYMIELNTPVLVRLILLTLLGGIFYLPLMIMLVPNSVKQMKTMFRRSAASLAPAQ